MKIVELFKTLTGKFEEDDNEKKALKSKVFTLSRIISEIMKQYRSFGLLSPAILREASESLSGISHEVREIFERNGFTLYDVDVVPRREYVTLVESYNRINTQYLKLVEEIEKAKHAEAEKPETVEDKPEAVIAEQKITAKRKYVRKTTSRKK